MVTPVKHVHVHQVHVQKNVQHVHVIFEILEPPAFNIHWVFEVPSCICLFYVFVFVFFYIVNQLNLQVCTFRGEEDLEERGLQGRIQFWDCPCGG